MTDFARCKNRGPRSASASLIVNVIARRGAPAVTGKAVACLRPCIGRRRSTRRDWLSAARAPDALSEKNKWGAQDRRDRSRPTIIFATSQSTAMQQMIEYDKNAD